jgi:hypothetical protein
LDLQLQLLSYFSFSSNKQNEIEFSEQALSYTLLSEPIRAVTSCIKIRAGLIFALSNNFFFLYLSLCTTFESKTWQFTKMFEIEFGKNISEFL